MFETLKNAFKTKEIRIKIWLTLALLFVYKIGCYIPIPGIEAEAVQTMFQSNDFLNVVSLLSGGSMQNATLFSLGILPFINAFIIMELLTIAIPKLEKLSKEGELGRKKLTQITRYVALVLAVIQSIGVLASWYKAGGISKAGIFGIEGLWQYPYLTLSCICLLLVSGSIMVMWLSERMTEYGIGNGTSLIIFVGILSSFGIVLSRAFKMVGEHWEIIWNILGFLIIVFAIFLFIVFMDMSERRVPVQYAKQIKGNKMYGGRSTHIPIRVNSGGVMPIIFASSICMFPELIINLTQNVDAISWYHRYMGAGTAVYYIFLVILIIFFSYFYSMIQFNPDDIARNIQQSGGMIMGIRPGKPTSDYLRRINNRIVLVGAIFLAILALIPVFIFQALSNTPYGDLQFGGAFSATGLLIVVSVALELNKQLESQIMMRHYKGFLK